MDRSPGFGSTPSNLIAHLRLAFATAPHLKCLTLLLNVTRWPVLQKVRGHTSNVLPQLVSAGFQVLFHSPPGVLFTFPSQYYALSVTKEYLALGGGPPCFPRGFSCPVVLWIILVAFSFQLQGYYLLWRSFPTLFIYDIASMLYVRNPNEVNFIGLACSAFARRYLRNRISFFSSGYLDVSVPRVPLAKLCIHLTILRHYSK